ncbi:MAG: hypothetical protein OHK0032_07970 [Thermodesulfovibrionales bacterium]
MKKLGREFEDIMAASAFAEAGEFEGARQILKGNRRVLLGLRKESINKKTLLYALNACKRIGTGLDILLISTDGEEPEDLKDFMKELEREGIGFNLTKQRGCLKKEILNFVKQRKNIDFVVIESSEGLEKECREGYLSDAWNSLKCPLVVVG